MAAANRDAMMRLRAGWKARGLCSRCGRRPASEDRARCGDCRQAEKLYRVYRIATSGVDTPMYEAQTST